MFELQRAGDYGRIYLTRAKVQSLCGLRNEKRNKICPMKTRFFYPTGAEIDPGFFDMCLKSWPLKARDLIEGSSISHPKVEVAELRAYLRLIGDDGIPAQVAMEIGIDRTDTGVRAYVLRTLVLRRTLEMSMGGELIDENSEGISIASLIAAAQIRMAMRVGLSAVVRVMNDCALATQGFPAIARQIEGMYADYATRGYDFTTEWDLEQHKKGLGLFAGRHIDPGPLETALGEIAELRHAWELAEFEAGGQRLGQKYFRQAGRWSGRMDLTPGSPGRARAERFVAQHGRQYAGQGDAIQS